MTLGFIFKIRDAWVIVADKRTTSEVKITEASEEIAFLSDNKIKIESLKHNLFFVGAGEEEYLEKIIKEINNSDTFEDFKSNLWIKMGGIYGGLYSEVAKGEEFIVVDQKSQKAYKFETNKVKEKINLSGVCEITGDCSDNNFIGFFEASVHKGISEIKIMSFRNQLFNEIKIPFYNSCNNILSDFSIDFLEKIGHPSIQGSNIWVVSEDKIRKVFTFPKNNYNYEEYEE